MLSSPALLWATETACPTDSRPELPGANSELSAERAVEVRYIAEAAIERNVKYFCRLERQAHRCVTQARSHQVLMRRDAGETFEAADKMKSAQPGFAREPVKREPLIAIALDSPQDERHTRNGACSDTVGVRRLSSRKPDACAANSRPVSSHGISDPARPANARATIGDNSRKAGRRSRPKFSAPPWNPASATRSSK